MPFLIETDEFPFEFLSVLAERESWRKEIHRPIYYLHKWWAKRLGSVFRGILLGCALDERADLTKDFFESHSFDNVTVYDPFLGSGTTVGEAHKLGFTALGRDINPVAVESARVSFGPMDKESIEKAYQQLSVRVGEQLMDLYRSLDSNGQACDVLYYFWVMQASCVGCSQSVDLFTSRVFARNAYPKRKPLAQAVCPSCEDVQPVMYGQTKAICHSCGESFNPTVGQVKGAKAHCKSCGKEFRIIDAIKATDTPPVYRLYAKLVLTQDGRKEYLPVSSTDLIRYQQCHSLLEDAVREGRVALPSLTLRDGYNTRQAMGYGFHCWRDFFNDRQLLGLGLLHQAISEIEDEASRDVFLTLFSGVLEFNNMFASYKGEGTGAVRHMFAHHILKPERMPIEANIWGTPKSSGAFSGLYRSRLLRAITYRECPKELSMNPGGKGFDSPPPFSGSVDTNWPPIELTPRSIYLSCGDSAASELLDKSVDIIVTDPPFFDNVHYSELADFFYAWQQLTLDNDSGPVSTRSSREVQDSDREGFSEKLRAVFADCHRVLKDEGLLVFTYHHSRDDGWKALAKAILGAGFIVINTHPVKSEMSVAMPKSQAKEPIQLDIIMVCRKSEFVPNYVKPSLKLALKSAQCKLNRLEGVGLNLSLNDRRVVIYGSLLTAIESACDLDSMTETAEQVSAA